MVAVPTPARNTKGSDAGELHHLRKSTTLISTTPSHLLPLLP